MLPILSLMTTNVPPKRSYSNSEMRAPKRLGWTRATETPAVERKDLGCFMDRNQQRPSMALGFSFSCLGVVLDAAHSTLKLNQRQSTM